MKRVLSFDETPGLKEWVDSVLSVVDGIHVTFVFLIDKNPASSLPVKMRLTEEIIRKHLDYLGRRGSGFLLEEAYQFKVCVSEKSRKRLKNQKIPSEITVKLSWS